MKSSRRPGGYMPPPAMGTFVLVQQTMDCWTGPFGPVSAARRYTFLFDKPAVSMMSGNDQTVAEIAEHFKVSRSTLYNLLASSPKAAQGGMDG